jgi:hypothetical protein
MNFTFSNRARSNQPMGIGGKLFVSIICLVFFAGGIIIACKLGRQIIESLQTRNWQSTECIIIRRSIAEKSPYTARVDYTYQVNGKSYNCDILSNGYSGGDDYYDAQKILDAYPTGSHSTCRVNPADPTTAVLRTPSLWIVFEILFPLVFIVIGGGLFVLIWRMPKNTTNPPIPSKPKNASNIIFPLFFIAGVVLLCLFVSNYQRYRSAQSWIAIPCTIVHSSVQSHSSNDSTTYSVEVLFRYTFNKKQYESSRYSLTHESSSGYDAKQQIVDQLNKHHKQTCYVNPLDPADAVLDRHSAMLLIILAIMGGVFILIGGGAMAIGLRSVRNKHHDDADGLLPLAQRGPVTLHPESPRQAELIAVWCMALFWNGIVSVFVVTDVDGWTNHRGDIGLTVFLIPFVLIGIGFIIAAIYKIGSLFQPGVHLTLNHSPLCAGELAELRWQITGNVSKIRNLQIRNATFDVAILPSNSDSTRVQLLKKQSPDWSEDLLNSDRQTEIQSGRRTLTISDPTARKDSSKRTWAIEVIYDLGKSKPMKEVFPMHVVEAKSVG